MTVTPASPITLPCGAVVKNRLLKSAMSEAMGTSAGKPKPELCTLYKTWATGGIGLSITGNVMIDHRAIGEPGNVVIEDDSHITELEAWAAAGKQSGTSLWMQINHPGKQVPRGLNREGVSPSAVPFDKALRNMFATPRQLRSEEIEQLISRFERTASIAKQAGFDGVQIHGAHGYLVSQFLSPHHNQRTDEWGGDPERRRRFVLAVYARIRQTVGSNFPIGIKLNSADFQRGGFTEEESLETVADLGNAGIDLIEISGGNYESPAMARGPGTANVKQSTAAREAYFLQFAEKARNITRTPLAVTGGFRTTAGIEAALESGALDMVGLGRPLVLDPELPNRVMAREPVRSSVAPIRTGVGLVDRSAMMEVTYYGRQLKRIGRGQPPRPDESPTKVLLSTIARQGIGAIRNRLRPG